MKTRFRRPAVAVAFTGVIAACDAASSPLTAPDSAAAARFDPDRSAWSEPVNLGPVINSGANDLAATLSPDGLFVRSVNRDGTTNGEAVPVPELNHPISSTPRRRCAPTLARSSCIHPGRAP